MLDLSNTTCLELAKCPLLLRRTLLAYQVAKKTFCVGGLTKALKTIDMKIMVKTLWVSALLISPLLGFSQEESSESEEPIVLFHDTRVVNGHSVEVLEKNTFDLRITHRFGDAGRSSSGRTLFGIDNATDIRIGFEYGITDAFMIGAGRSKGAGIYSEFWDGLAKYKILSQSSTMPVSFTAVVGSFFTSMQKDPNLSSPTAFQKTAHRFSYFSQLIVAHGFGEWVTLQLSPTWVHRNFVAADDRNGTFAVGAVAKVKILNKLSFITEYYWTPKRNVAVLNQEFISPLAAGIEFKTYAHAFQLVFMNSAGIGEGQFIPYTSSKWLEGGFRFGFTISRHF